MLEKRILCQTIANLLTISKSATMSAACGTLKHKRTDYNGLEKCPARCVCRCARANSRLPTCWSGKGSASRVCQRGGSSRAPRGAFTLLRSPLGGHSIFTIMIVLEATRISPPKRNRFSYSGISIHL